MSEAMRQRSDLMLLVISGEPEYINRALVSDTRVDFIEKAVRLVRTQAKLQQMSSRCSAHVRWSAEIPKRPSQLERLSTRAVHNCEIVKTYEAVLDGKRKPASYGVLGISVAEFARRFEEAVGGTASSCRRAARRLRERGGSRYRVSRLGTG